MAIRPPIPDFAGGPSRATGTDGGPSSMNRTTPGSASALPSLRTVALTDAFSPAAGDPGAVASMTSFGSGPAFVTKIGDAHAISPSDCLTRT